MSPQEQIDILTIRALSKSLDELINACLNNQGNIKSPLKSDIIKAKKMLPKGYTHSLIKNNKEDGVRGTNES